MKECIEKLQDENADIDAISKMLGEAKRMAYNAYKLYNNCSATEAKIRDIAYDLWKAIADVVDNLTQGNKDEMISKLQDVIK